MPRPLPVLLPLVLLALSASRAIAVAVRPATRQGGESAPTVEAEYARNEMVFQVLVAASPGQAAEAAPPRGWKVVSGGGDARGARGARLTGSYPVLDAQGVPTAWRATASAPGVEASVVALYDPADKWDVAVFQGSASAGAEGATAVARLPEEAGYELVGFGAALRGDWGVGLTRLSPDGDSAVRATAPSGCDGSAGAGEHAVTAYAIGLRRDGYEVSSTADEAATDVADGAAETRVPAADGYGITAAGAVVDGSGRCAGFIDMLKPGARGAKAFGSAYFTAGAGGAAGITVTGLMVEAPSMF